MKEKIAVIIPCYNEEKTIAKVVKDLKKALPESTIYVYDNNSTDKTVKKATEAGAIIRYEQRQGKGNVIRTMFREIEANCYLMIDGDDTYSASHAKEMCNYILDGTADMVIGDRLSSTYYTENKRKFHNFGNDLVKRLINIIFKSNIHDIMTGYRALSYRFVKGFPVLSKGFEIETEMTIHAIDKNFKIKEIPIIYKDRIEGSESKLNTYSDGFKVLKTIGKLFKEYRPFSFFGLLSLLFFIIGFIIGLPAYIGYFKTGLVMKFPSLIVSCFAFTISLLLFITGLILDTIVTKQKQDYELYLNQLEIINKEKLIKK